MVEKDFEYETTETDTVTVCDDCGTEAPDNVEYVPVEFVRVMDTESRRAKVRLHEDFPTLHYHPEHVDNVSLEDVEDLSPKVIDVTVDVGPEESNLTLAATNMDVVILFISIIGLGVGLRSAGLIQLFGLGVFTLGLVTFVQTGKRNAEKAITELA